MKTKLLHGKMVGAKKIWKEFSQNKWSVNSVMTLTRETDTTTVR